MQPRFNIFFELIMYDVIFVLVELRIYYCKRLGVFSHFVDNKKNCWLQCMIIQNESETEKRCQIGLYVHFM